MDITFICVNAKPWCKENTGFTKMVNISHIAAFWKMDNDTAMIQLGNGELLETVMPYNEFVLEIERKTKLIY